jgi:outer membrane protein assembly factor BamB
MIVEEDPANNTFYLYTGCEYDDGVAGKDGGDGDVYARKINGLTGEIIWTSEPFTARSPKDGVDGVILATPVLGKEGTSMAGLVIFNVTQEVKGDSTTSELVAFDKLTGKIVWRYDMDAKGWSPSSPVPVYTEDGQGYLIQCDINGDIALLKVTGQTCEEVDVLHTADKDKKEYNHFEATPVVFENFIVVGSRSNKLFFIEIS